MTIVDDPNRCIAEDQTEEQALIETLAQTAADLLCDRGIDVGLSDVYEVVEEICNRYPEASSRVRSQIALSYCIEQYAS